LIVRKATWADEDVLAELYRAANTELGSKYGRGESIQLVFDVLRYALQNDDAVFLAFDGDWAVGAVAWTHTPLARDGVAVGVGTFVRPEYRRSDVSRKLRQAASDYCKEKGYTSVEGVVAEGNVAGLQSALDNGFKVVGYLVEKQL
jgi:GNAT superfamily N-acetyltransferase